MSASLKQIEDQARALIPEERAKLAESMIESLHSPLAEIEQAWQEEIEQRVAAAFLQKPFTPGALAQKVREVMDQAR